MTASRTRVIRWLRRPDVSSSLALLVAAAVSVIPLFDDFNQYLPFLVLCLLITGVSLLTSSEHERRYRSAKDSIVMVVRSGHIHDIFNDDAKVDRVQVNLSSAFTPKLSKDLESLSQRFSKVTVFHTVGSKIPDSLPNIQRMPVFEDGHISRLVWEENGVKRLALYANERQEWISLPVTQATRQIAGALHEQQSDLEPRDLFTDYEWVCAVAATEARSLDNIKQLAREGAVELSSVERIRELQQQLTGSARSILAIDSTEPEEWLSSERLRGSLTDCGVITSQGGRVSRIFVHPSTYDRNPEQDERTMALGLVLYLHKKLGIYTGVVEAETIQTPLLVDHTLYNDAVLWEEHEERGNGKFRASPLHVDEFKQCYERLLSRDNRAAERRSRLLLGTWGDTLKTEKDQAFVDDKLAAFELNVRQQLQDV